MSMDNNRWNGDSGDNPAEQVIDEEGTVEQKIKSRIIEARKHVDDSEDAVFIEAPLREEVNLSRGEQVHIWGTSVRQFLRTIEPLLRSDKIDKAGKYYKEVPIGEEPVYPPDGKYPQDPNRGEQHTYRWGMFYRDGVENHELIQQHPKLTRGFEPPKPKQVGLQGLQDVIETKKASYKWAVTVNPDEPPFRQQTVFPEITMPLKKEWLEKAVRLADQFLQEAGIGLEIGNEGLPTDKISPEYNP